jgi:hypothetical protein
MRHMLPSLLVACLVVAPCATLNAQQLPDREFRPVVTAPRWATNSGPRLCLDEAHHNFHTLDGRYAAFGALAERDGFRVSPNRASFSSTSLAQCDLLVIANAQPSDAPWDQYPVPTPSAFSPTEIDATRRWVESGGALLLIADHMPLAGAAAQLAAAFGFTFLDGFATAPAIRGDGVRATMDRPAVFRSSDSSLRTHRITQGLAPGATVQSIRTFTGQAFRPPADAEAVLVVPADWVMLLPRRAWQFTDSTRSMPVGGWLQGATRTIGRAERTVHAEHAALAHHAIGPRGAARHRVSLRYARAPKLIHSRPSTAPAHPYPVGAPHCTDTSVAIITAAPASERGNAPTVSPNLQLHSPRRVIPARTPKCSATIAAK